jgi:PPE-repeat protein
MIDFAALPPEINSARMYSGAGAAPLLAAAASWEALSVDLAQAATEFRSTVTALAGVWIGPSAAAMTTAATAYTAWLTMTAEQAGQSATQALAAVQAYEAARAATIPPAVIAGNRAQLAALVATNFLGINTPAIMATEALYAEMWAQDAAAMFGYQAQSAAATSALPQFTAAPQVTNPAATPANPLLQFMQTLIPGFTPGQPLQNLADLLVSPLFMSFVSSGPYQLPGQVLQLFTVLWAVTAGQSITNRITGGNNNIEIPPALMPLATPAAQPEAKPEAAAIRAGLADGERIGGLRVPPSWAQQRSPETQNTPAPARPIVPTPDLAALGGLGGLGGLGALAAIPRGGTPTKQQRPEPEYGTRSSVVPKHPFGG